MLSRVAQYTVGERSIAGYSIGMQEGKKTVNQAWGTLLMKTLNFIKHRFIASETLPVDFFRGLFVFILNAAEIKEAKEILTKRTLNFKPCVQTKIKIKLIEDGRREQNRH